MKKVFLTSVVAMMSVVASAQMWMGGAVGFGIEDPDVGDKITTVTIAPEVGYTLNEKWDIAAAFNYSYEKQGDIKNTGWAIEPYARYTFAEVGIAKFFVEGAVAYGSEEETMVDVNTGKTTKADGWQFSIGVRPGIKVDVNDNLAVVTKLGLLGYKHVNDIGKEFGFNVNANAISLGLVWKF